MTFEGCARDAFSTLRAKVKRAIADRAAPPPAASDGQAAHSRRRAMLHSEGTLSEHEYTAANVERRGS
jgi:hypothetical protein